MTNTRELLKRRRAVVAGGVPMATELCVASASGSVLTDLEGREILDFATGIGVMTIGHGHPAVIEAVARQVANLQHVCIHIATYEPYVALCEKLAALFPHGDETQVLLLNSGAEAVENAVKIARQATRRSAVVCFTEGFHGRTLLGMSLTSKVGYKKNCGPFAPEIYRLPFPNRYVNGDGLSEDAFVERELWRFREALVQTVRAEEIAAVLIEVVQGEGGFVTCPPAYLRGLRALCDEHGILLICDEVQAGMGRTGRWAAYEHAGITPDLSTWAKAMGGGLPISAVVGKAAIMREVAPGTLGGTYGGNPVACASALAAIDVMERADVCARARHVGEIIGARFESLKAKCSVVGDARGLGAMRAIELSLDGDPHEPATAIAGEAARRCLEAGLLLLTTGPHGNILRMLPPLTVSDDELDRGLTILERAVLAAARSAA